MCLLLKIDTAKNRKSSHVHDIILIGFDFPQGIRIHNQNRHASPGAQPAKNRNLCQIIPEKVQKTQNVSRINNMCSESESGAWSSNC
jgi:hypothetical protein